MKAFLFLLSIAIATASTAAFTPVAHTSRVAPVVSTPTVSSFKPQSSNRVSIPKGTTQLQVTPDYAVVSLVAGQENYGLAIVALGEAIWSFAEAPSLSHAKVLVPAIISAIILVAVSGPMITNSADPAAISLGLEVATGVSVFLGASYVARLLAPFSPSAKEIAFGGLLIAVAGFFSFSQNLVVDGFINLPHLPQLPSIFPKNEFSD